MVLGVALAYQNSERYDVTIEYDRTSVQMCGPKVCPGGYLYIYWKFGDFLRNTLDRPACKSIMDRGVAIILLRNSGLKSGLADAQNKRLLSGQPALLLTLLLLNHSLIQRPAPGTAARLREHAHRNPGRPFSSRTGGACSAQPGARSCSVAMRMQWDHATPPGTCPGIQPLVVCGGAGGDFCARRTFRLAGLSLGRVGGPKGPPTRPSAGRSTWVEPKGPPRLGPEQW